MSIEHPPLLFSHLSFLWVLANSQTSPGEGSGFPLPASVRQNAEKASEWPGLSYEAIPLLSYSGHREPAPAGHCPPV